MNNRDSPEYDFQRFLKDNLPLLTVIGIFAAISKFFLETDKVNGKILSEFSMVLTIFSLIVYTLVTIIHLFRRFKGSIDAGSAVFIRSSVNDIIIALFGLFVVGMVWGIVNILINEYSIDIQYIFFMIGLFLALLISIYVGLYIFWKVTDMKTIIVLGIFYLIIFGIVEIVFKISSNMQLKYQDLLVLPLGPVVIFVLIVNAVIFPLLLWKFMYHGMIKDILSKCKIFLAPLLEEIWSQLKSQFIQFRMKLDEYLVEKRHKD
jgi:hypothetical protein